MTTTGHDILIIGGGIIGLSLAWRLGQRRMRTAVLDSAPSHAGSCTPYRPGQATPAAAGMLSPFAEQPGRNPLVELALEGFRRYPAFLDELPAGPGGRAALMGEGTLRVARSADEAEELQRQCAWQRCCGLPMEWLEAAAVGQLEPALGDWPWPASFSPEERFVMPTGLWDSLARAAAGVGVDIILGAEVRAFQTAGERATAVQTTAGSFSAGAYVLAAGAWTAALAAELGVPIAVRPVKGQTLRLDNVVDLKHVLFAPGGLLQPRGAGRLFVGSTEEEAGFDHAVTAGGVHRLLDFAFSILPELASSRLISRGMTGFRPGTPDQLPILGPLPGWENVHIATGHFRKGILLAPLTADLMAEWLLSGVLPPAMTPLLASRFAG